LSVWQRIWLHTFHKDTLRPSGVNGRPFACSQKCEQAANSQAKSGEGIANPAKK